MKRTRLSMLLATCLVFTLAKKGFSEAPLDRSARFFAGIDYSVGSNVNKTFEDSTRDAVNTLVTAGASAQGTTKTTEGLGGRIGVMFPLRAIEGLELGSSLGYYTGPKGEQTINGDASGTPFTLTNTVKTRFYRLLAEGTKKFPITSSVAFKIGLGAGVAQGRAMQDSNLTGLGAPTSDSNTETWTGFTWEASPAIVISRGRSDFEVGVRYAQFPTHKESDNIVKIDWSPLFVYAGVSF